MFDFDVVTGPSGLAKRSPPGSNESIPRKGPDSSGQAAAVAQKERETIDPSRRALPIGHSE